MTVLLHEGHEATEAVASGAYSETSIVLVVGLIVVVAVLVYGAVRYGID